MSISFRKQKIVMLAGFLSIGFLPITNLVMAEGEIKFWEGNNATQDQVGNTLDGDQDYNINCKDHDEGFSNDEARSMSLENIPGSSLIKVYDDPDANDEDDNTSIYVTGPIECIIVGTFEETRVYNDECGGPNKAEVTYSGGNGLDGKISRIMIDYLGGGAKSRNLKSELSAVIDFANKTIKIDGLAQESCSKSKKQKSSSGSGFQCQCD